MAEIEQRILARLQGVNVPSVVDPRVSQGLQKPLEESSLTPVGRVFETAGSAVADLFDTPIGMSPESRQELVELGMLGTPEQQATNPILAINDTLIEGTVAGVDTAFRVLQAPFLGGIAAVGQAAQELGMDPTSSGKLVADLEGLLLATGVAAGGAAGGLRKPRRGRKKRGVSRAVEKPRARAGTLEEGSFVVNVQREGLNVTITQREGKPFITLQEAEAFARVVEKDLGPDAVFSLAVKQKIGESLVTVPVAQREAIRARLGQSFDEAQIKLKEELNLGDTGFPERIKEPISRKVTQAAEAALVEGRVKRNKDQPISDQIIQMMQEDRLIADDVTKILKEQNITIEEFARLFRVNKSEAGRTLQAFSALEQRLKSLGIVEGELDEARRIAGFDAQSRLGNIYKRVDNVRRALLVSALKTAARNAITQGGRVSLAVIERSLEKATERLFLPANARSGEPIQAFGETIRLFRRAKTKKEVDKILEAFPSAADEMFLRFSSDIAAAPEVQAGRALSKGEKILRKSERAATIANVFNRFQEFAFRRAVLASSIDRRLRARGTTLEDVIRKNDLLAITPDDIRVGVSEALELTFAKKFSPTAKGFDGLAGKFVSLVTNLPGATLAVPFPRFMMQALQFQYEFSPLGFSRILKFVSPAQRRAISRGDVKAINKAVIGSTTFLMAWQLRNSEFAGEKWWEVKIPKELAGELGVDVPEGGSAVVDLRPFNPFATQLFIADLIKRKRDDTLFELGPKDIAVGVLGAGARAGTGLAIIDSLVESIAGVGGEKDVRLLNEFLGNIAAGFLTPINQLQDFVAAFDESEAVIRRGVEAPFTDVIQRRLPGLSQQLPPLESPTRAAPPRIQAPLLRPLTGLSIRDKNVVERELDRLDFRYREIAPSTGNPRANQAINAELGPLVEQHLTPFIESDLYRQLPNDSVRAAVLKQVLNKLRSGRGMARDRAEAKNPELFAVLKGEQVPKRQRRAVESVTGQTPAEIIEESVERIR